MDINIKLLDFLIDLIELQEVIQEKNSAVRKQEFNEATNILEKQRAIEGRILTSAQLKELRNELTKQP